MCLIELLLASGIGFIQVCITYIMARDMTGKPQSESVAAILLFSFILIPLLYCTCCSNAMVSFAHNPPNRIDLPLKLRKEYKYFVYGKYLGIAAVAVSIACCKFIAPFDDTFARPLRSLIIRTLVAFNIIECAVLEWHLGEDRELHYRINAVAGVFLTLTELIQGWVRPVTVSESPTWGRMFRHNVSPSWVICYLFWNIKFGSTIQAQGEIWHLCASHVFAIIMALTTGTDYLDFRIPALHAHFSLGLVTSSVDLLKGPGIMGAMADRVTMSNKWMWTLAYGSGAMALLLVRDTIVIWNGGRAPSIGAIVDYGTRW